MSATGTWKVLTQSPVGAQPMDLVLEQSGSTLTGRATSGDETVDITDGGVDGDNLTWKVAISKPMKMNLLYTVVLEGDSFSGKAKPGVFPPVTVTATRA